MIDPDDLPRDPDLDSVPEDLRRLDGQQVLVHGEPAVLVIVEGIFGHSDRLRRGFYDNADGA